LPIVHSVDQCRILFLQEVKMSVGVLAKKICYPEILSIANKYNIQCLDVSVGQVRRCVWETFSNSVM